MARLGAWVRWWLTDSNGRLVLVQLPNPPLLLWAAATAITWIAEGTLEAVAEVVAFGAIFAWAWLELFQGVTPFRRLLGAVVGIVVVWWRVNALT